MKNTTTFEASVGGRILLEQMRQLADAGAAVSLEGPSMASAQMGAALGADMAQVGSRLRFHGVQLGVGDVLFLGRQPCIVRACAQEGTQFYLIVELFRCAPSVSGSSTCRLEAGLRDARLGDHELTVAYAWAEKDDGAMLVLHREV